jgi:hypothetical protein
MEYFSCIDFKSLPLVVYWSPDNTVAQVIYNHSILNLIKSYPHDTLTTCSCNLCGTLYTVHSKLYMYETSKKK